jgi:hypothetical protein
MPRIIEMGVACYSVLKHIREHAFIWMDQFPLFYGLGHHQKTAFGEKGIIEIILVLFVTHHCLASLPPALPPSLPPSLELHSQTGV